MKGLIMVAVFLRFFRENEKWRQQMVDLELKKFMLERKKKPLSPEVGYFLLLNFLVLLIIELVTILISLLFKMLYKMLSALGIIVIILCHLCHRSQSKIYYK